MKARVMNELDILKRTIDYYDKNAESWSRSHCYKQEQSFWKEEMEKFHELLPKGKVIEIGSGSGKDAKALVDFDYDYMGTDVSKGLLKAAKRNNPNETFLNIAVQDLVFDGESFDGFWTVATLLHIPKNKIGAALQSIKNIIKPGGVGFISLKAGSGESVDPNTGRWWSYYSLEEFHGILNKNGFEVIEERTRKGDSAWWLMYWVRRK